MNIDKSKGMIIIEKPTDCWISKVSNLIQNAQCKMELIDTVFNKTDCRSIRKIPVSIDNSKVILV